MIVIYFNAFLFLLQLSTVSSSSETWKETQRWSVDAAQAGSTSKISSRFRRSVQEVYDFEELGFADVAVDAHNQARRTVEPPAADMREMSWDNELAALALAYSQQCVYEHNPARSHSRFAKPGENLYISYGIDFDADYVRNALGDWDAERIDYDYETMTCTPGKPCGHYTQMVWASTFKVGCGATKCSSIEVNNGIWMDATLLVCNYGPAGNYVGEQPYTSGFPCDDCEDASDVCSDDLCFNPSRLTDLVSANWLDWSNWGECSASCGGNGRRYRTRKCSTYVLSDCEGYSRQFDPYCANKECPEAGATETQEVTTTRTTTSTPSTPNTPSTSSSSSQYVCDDWSAWGSCTVSCGGGGSRRTRVCRRQEGNVIYTQTRTRIRSCRTESCNTGSSSSGWSLWNTWSDCNNLCGEGMRIRFRTCAAPPCQGSNSEIGSCSSTELC